MSSAQQDNVADQNSVQPPSFNEENHADSMQEVYDIIELMEQLHPHVDDESEEEEELFQYAYVDL